MLQDSNSPLMEQMIFFHDHTLFIMIIITILILYLIMTMFLNKYMYRYLSSGQLIETIWTLLPTLILISIALPSLRLLYIMDETNNPSITVKSIGHQWYWSYEYTDYKSISFDSYMIPINTQNPYNFRLLDVDNRLILPFKSQIRMLITSNDVIHAWTLPSLGIKMDSIPGRLNQSNLIMNRPGLYFGQCSEICGTNHSFMPITIESISISNFLKWINSFT
uniref:Cytochrome c oxidase subunit 2 n=1 Tax=Brachycerus muricatus TaxID=159793 RepID=J9PHX6_9CUCU|nr:cytochrome c oxidase subunit II [Brachycerus muricatus]